MHAHHHNPLTFLLADEAATLALGAALAPTLHAGLVITLEGDLGAGKTTLVRGLLRALGYGNKVKSPTYTLVEVHAVSGLNLYHFDFYRFNEPEEYLDAGLDEYFQASGPNAGVCLVEWPDKAGQYLPAPDLRVSLAVSGDGRVAQLHANSPQGAACLKNLPSHSSVLSTPAP
jgi:tRNA threonylcarbamoyladenosine biosynthesis protein TsaE